MTEHKTLDEALVAFQAAVPALPKDSTNPHFNSRFTSLDTITEQISGLLAEHGLTWSTLPTIADGKPALRYRLSHVTGGELMDTMPLLLDKTNSQGLGSAITYARRYSITCVLNLVSDEDDDGNAASRPAAPARDLATDEDVNALQSAAAGLSPAQIKGVIAQFGLKNVTAYNHVPRDKVAEVAKALAAADRTAA